VGVPEKPFVGRRNVVITAASSRVECFPSLEAALVTARETSGSSAERVFEEAMKYRYRPGLRADAIAEARVFPQIETDWEAGPLENHIPMTASKHRV
jgi:hypothetical protein